MNKKNIKVGIVGISGYSGLETLKLLLNHPHAHVTYVSANNTTGRVTDIWPQLKEVTKLTCEKFNAKNAVKAADVFFLAVPHTVAMAITPQLLRQGKHVIDISGDYRLKNVSSYKKWYGAQHTDGKNLSKAVYGLPELYREKIKKAKLIANPGCYPTAAILGLAPLAATATKAIDSIIIDAKSGVSGAGRKAKVGLLFSETAENFKAYKVFKHQHTPEIELYLSKLAQKSLSVTFTPHLLPINRGILETIYIRLKHKTTTARMHALYKKFYKTEPFVRISPAGTQPEIKDVAHSNYCDIGIAAKGDTVIVTSVIDNLVKGAAGQAIQNMNIMFNYKETEGLS